MHRNHEYYTGCNFIYNSGGVHSVEKSVESVENAFYPVIKIF